LKTDNNIHKLMHLLKVSISVKTLVVRVYKQAKDYVFGTQVTRAIVFGFFS